MDQSWCQNKGGDDCAMEERYYHVELDQAMSISQVDDGGLLMMELLEDLPPSDLVDGDVDRLSHVIRSLEAEIGGGAAAVMVDAGSMASPSSEEDGRLLDEMLSDLDDGSFGYWPSEVPFVGHDQAAGWYLLYADGCVSSEVGYEAIDNQCHYVESSFDEQVYSPLWE